MPACNECSEPIRGAKDYLLGKEVHPSCKVAAKTEEKIKWEQSKCRFSGNLALSQEIVRVETQG